MPLHGKGSGNRGAEGASGRVPCQSYRWTIRQSSIGMIGYRHFGLAQNRRSSRCGKKSIRRQSNRSTRNRETGVRMSGSAAVMRINSIIDAGPWPVRPSTRLLLDRVSVPVNPRGFDPFIAKRKGEWYLQTLMSSCQNLWKFPSKANGRSVCRSRHLVHVATL